MNGVRVIGSACLLLGALAAPSFAQAPKQIDVGGPADFLTERYTLMPGPTKPEAFRLRTGSLLPIQPIGYQGARLKGPLPANPITGEDAFAPDNGGFIRLEWTRAEPPFFRGQPFTAKPVDDVFCAFGRAQRNRRSVCLRDADKDGRFEAIADPSPILPPRLAALHFSPLLAPVAYEAFDFTAPDERGQPQVMNIYGAAFDGGLRIGLSPHIATPFSGKGWYLQQSIVIPPGGVPNDVILHGARISILSYDRSWMTLRLDSVLTTGPVILRPNDPRDPAKLMRLAEPGD